jgi:hypothetical protein
MIAIPVAFAKVSVERDVFAATWRRRAFEGEGQDGERGRGRRRLSAPRLLGCDDPGAGKRVHS